MPAIRKRTRLYILLLLLLIRKRDEHTTRGTRRWWVHSINQKRDALGEFNQLVTELRQDEQRHFQYFRMKTAAFDEILRIVGPHITFKDTRLRKAIPARARLAVTLR